MAVNSNYGKWKVSSNYICGEYQFIAVRLIDKDGVDHSGNREYAGDYSTDEKAVQKLVAELNAKEKEAS